MSESKVIDSGAKIIEPSESFIDVYADVATITAFTSQGDDCVNICFMRDFITSTIDASGIPNAATISLKKVASITMSESRARALYNALGGALKVEGGSK